MSAASQAASKAKKKMAHTKTTSQIAGKRRNIYTHTHNIYIYTMYTYIWRDHQDDDADGGKEAKHLLHI